jgi:hypothetical protein
MMDRRRSLGHIYLSLGLEVVANFALLPLDLGKAVPWPGRPSPHLAILLGHTDSSSVKSKAMPFEPKVLQDHIGFGILSVYVVMAQTGLGIQCARWLFGKQDSSQSQDIQVALTSHRALRDNSSADMGEVLPKAEEKLAPFGALLDVMELWEFLPARKIVVEVADLLPDQ